jgi:hypothetical protein
MKFEKFLKGCGTHGQILERSNGDKWLICGGVGMKVPVGVVNLLGSGEVGEKTKKIIEALVRADTDDKVVLDRAYVAADGKASDIVRIFSGINIMDECIEVGIHNATFGLLEKADINLAEVEIEDDNNTETKYLIVLDHEDDVIGFIQGVNNY